jgi:alkane 1-monooxygenase
MKYFTAYLLPSTVVFAFLSDGWWTFFPVLFAFGIIPILEFVLGKNAYNLSDAERELVKEDKLYDLIIYSTVFIHVGILIWFLNIINDYPLAHINTVGRIVSMGMMCGVFGINVAHELGHRTTKAEQFMAKLMLSTTLYMHFFIEHNKGHHRNVGTPADAATARKGESVYVFWFRSIIGTYLSAWRIENKERRRKGKTEYSFGNEMVQYQIIQLALVAGIFFIFGLQAMIGFVISAVIGIFLLETVNYIEHYGLERKKINEYRYEDVNPSHSWNSDYALGRLVLFELTRHSDHHTTPSKHYQLLDTTPDSSELPAGYPSMMLLALVPPMWYKVVNKIIR